MRPSGKKNQPTCSAFKKGERPKRNVGDYSESSFFTRMKFQAYRKRTEAKYFRGSRQTIGYHRNRGGTYFANNRSEGRHCTWCISNTDEIHCTAGWKDICEKVPTISRRAPLCATARRHRSHVRTWTTKWTKCQSPNALSYEQLGSCAEFMEGEHGICSQESLGFAQKQLQ